MLDISLSLMLVEIGIFLVTLLLLNQWLFKPLIDFMDKREAKLKADKDSVSGNKAEAEKYMEEINSILEAAKAEANKIRMSAYEEAKSEAKAKVEAKQQEIENKKAEFSKELVVKEEELKETLNSEVSTIKTLFTNRLKDIA